MRLRPMGHQKDPTMKLTARRGFRALDPRGYRLLLLSLIVVSFALLSNGSARRVSGNAGPRVNPALPGAQLQSRDGIWKAVDRTSLTARAESASPDRYHVVELNPDALSQVLSSAPMEFTKKAETERPTISLPMPDGSFASFRFEESPVMEPEL